MAKYSTSVILVIVLFGFVESLFDSTKEDDRILKYELNPGCQPSSMCQNSSLVHIRSLPVTKNHSLPAYDYLWIFSSYYKPTILLFETNPLDNLLIDWSRFRDHKSDFIRFNNSVQNSFGLEISNLFLINMTGENLIQNIPLENLQWQISNSSSITKNSIDIDFYNQNDKIGKFHFKISARNHNGRDDQLPHLFFSEAANLVRFSIDHISVQKNPDELKNITLQVCANFTVASQGTKINDIIHHFKSINDEFTPGVFQRYLYQMDTHQDNQTRSSYMAWKPVVYFDHSYELSKSLKTINPGLEPLTELPKDSALFGSIGKPYSATRMYKFRFNTADDSDFKFNNQSSLQFTFTCSLNNPKEEVFTTAMTVILICMAIVLVLVMVLFGVSLLYTIYKKIFDNRYYHFDEGAGGNSIE